MKMTKEKYKCIDCGKIDFLVVRYGRACRCKECYENYLEKRRILREINSMEMRRKMEMKRKVEMETRRKR